MKRSEASDVLITGVGVTAAIGQGRDAFVEALLQGAHRFDVLSRPGRQLPSAAEAVGGIAPPPFIGAELPALAMPARVPRSRALAWCLMIWMAPPSSQFTQPL